MASASMIDQKKEIHKLDFDVLIILDACRYDAFVKYWDLSPVEKAWSSGSDTPHWLANTFTRIYDITYYSANPFCSSVPNPCGWKGTDHFKKVIPVWDFGWRKVKGCWTVPPEEVFKAYEKYNDGEKAILHLMQPHTPFIGKRILPIPWLADVEKKKGIVRPSDVERTKALYPYWIKKYGEEYVRLAYYDNAEFVIERLKKFLSRLSGKIVITADHGELLGERGLWGHPANIIAPELRTVPWAVVKV